MISVRSKRGKILLLAFILKCLVLIKRIPKFIYIFEYLIVFCQPLYGYLKEKIQVATRVYFNEKDFARTEILEVEYLF